MDDPALGCLDLSEHVETYWSGSPAGTGTFHIFWSDTPGSVFRPHHHCFPTSSGGSWSHRRSDRSSIRLAHQRDVYVSSSRQRSLEKAKPARSKSSGGRLETFSLC